MPRKAAIAVSLLFVAGCVVALVQAQDAISRREAAQPGLLPHGMSAQPVSSASGATGSLSDALRATTEEVTSEYSAGDASHVNHTTGIKPTQYKLAQPRPTRMRGDTQSATGPVIEQGQVQAPGSIYSPVPTTPPNVAPAPSVNMAQLPPNRFAPGQATEQVTLGAPVEADVETLPLAQEQFVAAGEEPSVAPVGGMRSVLKRPQGASIGEAAAPAVQQPNSLNQAAPVVEAVDPVEDRSTGPTGISARRSLTPTVPSTLAPSQSDVNTLPSVRRSASADEPSAPRSIQDLALTGRSPALRVSVAGPQALTVGKAAPYVVNLFNDDDSDATNVQLKASLPAWVTVNSGESTAGEAAVQSGGNGTSWLVWNVPRVPAKSHQTLRLTLIADEGEPFELSVAWTSQPATAKATIAVKQPQLELALAGPAEMNFGDQQVFTLTVSNPGTGDADRVVVSISSGDNRPQQVDVGSIPAGMQKEIPVQVAANHAGAMSMKAVASAEGGLRAEAEGKVMVRRAEVALAVEGPALKYAGTDAVYTVIVGNSGDAPAEDVTVSVTLPTGSKYLGGVDGAAASSGTLKWKLANIPAGSERAFEVKLQLNGMGVNRVVAQANSAVGGTANGVAETQVEAISDLKLTVNDPAGPIAVGDDAIYELNLVNRGTKSAGGVRVVMQFGEGIEPISIEGAEARVVPGQVICEPFAQLPAGEKVTLKVRAAADRDGTHQFRVEVTTQDNETRLVTEGTTRFFTDATRSGGAAARTARNPSILPQSNPPGNFQQR